MGTGRPPPIIRGGISGADSIVSNDTSGARKMYQTDYSSNDRVGREQGQA